MTPIREMTAFSSSSRCDVHGLDPAVDKVNKPRGSGWARPRVHFSFGILRAFMSGNRMMRLWDKTSEMRFAHPGDFSDPFLYTITIFSSVSLSPGDIPWGRVRDSSLIVAQERLLCSLYPPYARAA